MLDYTNPRSYQIGGITFSGTESLDHSALRAISGLEVGQDIMVPGETITNAIKKLWKQELFTDVSVNATKIIDNQIFLNVHIVERPRLSKFRFVGIKKGKQETLRDEINLIRGKVVTQNLIQNTENKIRKYYIDKGYYNIDVEMEQEPDTLMSNSIILTIHIKRNERVKIEDIYILGNEELSDKKVKKAMKNTKERGIMRIFKPSKLTLLAQMIDNAVPTALGK